MSLVSVVIVYLLYLMAVAGQKLDQEISWTKKKGEVVSFSCKNNDQCGTYVFWYQKKEGEPFTLILDIEKDNCAVDASYNHPQKDDFSATSMNNNCELKIQSVKVSHSATYYCACWNPQYDTNHTSVKWLLQDSCCNRTRYQRPDCRKKQMQNSSIYGQGPAKTQCRLLFVKGIFTVYGFVFGSGTRLYVTDDKHVQKPKVTVYPASNPEPNGKITLLCLARDMFPDLVKISWKMEDEYSRTMEVAKAEREELEQREEGQTTSMIIIDKEKMYRNKYICSVEHEWGIQDVDIPRDSFPFMCSLNLASLVYTVMIVKSMVYCCGLSLLLHHRNMGKWTQHL
ncbi:uncharacterized protein LOC109894860 [Oncorhynchus kisutch]|uniref:uncharacterized protein LOC109894860 n=1 Tax=Oncorhynchus kisutch TaxID=8019 RepID=UPI0012DE8042|nr:uncharacterized protein LOC109894860 [Oncorhynchus kisutch]